MLSEEKTMYKCPNCAGNLTFDIALQQLHCTYCDTRVDPYGYYKEKDAEETQCLPGEYEATVFTCPQCGAALISEDTTAATFCSFCGASAILDSRVSRERRPGSIIPFTRTKEDCRAAYGKLLRRALFAPKELKDEALIEKFRGIYMPYWVYSLEKKERIMFPGRNTYRRGDYLITEHYQMDCRVDAEYSGLAYDASSSFSDSLSTAIAPFDLKEKKEFTPSFLSGFYADTSDVKEDVYLPEAEEFVIKDTCGTLAKDPVCRTYGAGRGETEYALKNAMRPSGSTAELALLPVWFLSYRNGSRVSYAVVNGQTGKAAADLPVDKKRYLAGSLILAIPLFFLLNLYFTFTPRKILLIAALLALLCTAVSNHQITNILARESGEDDMGLSSKRKELERPLPEWAVKKRRQSPVSPFGKALMTTILFYGIILLLVHTLEGKGEGILRLVLFFLPVLLFTGSSLMIHARGSLFPGSGNRKKPFLGGHFKEKRTTLIKPLAGILSAVVILVLNPVSDWFYYTGAFVCMGTVLWAIIDIINQHNLLATRKLPQLGKRGGDEAG